MKFNFGVFSLLTIGAALGLGFGFMIYMSVLAAIIYLVVILAGGYLILMSYCRKCPHCNNNTCRHYFPGKIAKRLPYKKTGKYTVMEISTVIVSVLILFAVPLFFLAESLVIMIVYLLLWGLGVLMVRLRVCPGCLNRWCPICPNRIKQ